MDVDLGALQEDTTLLSLRSTFARKPSDIDGDDLSFTDVSA